ncbi:MAG: ATP synthase subunit I [Gammaproteobacteria bacterium]|nr:ATP synthase subunit I [Gammaproteobacteria bacterium]
MLKSIPAKIVTGQLLVGIAGAAITWPLAGAKAALGAFLGGAIGALLSLYFAIRVFMRRDAESPRAMLRAFQRAEMLKFVMAAALFSLVAIYLADVWIPLMTTFVASLAVYGLALTWKSGDGY